MLTSGVTATAGQVEMAHNEVLEDDDVADGYILACQAVGWQAHAPQTPWRQENGGSRPSSMSTSSIRVPGGQASRRVAPSRLTSRVAATPPVSVLASNGFSAS